MSKTAGTPPFLSSPLYGAALCPQPADICDAGTAVMAAKKTKTFAKAGDSATVTIKGASGLAAKHACSYLIEATCDAPYAKLEGAGASWDSGNQAKMTYTVAEWSDVSVPTAGRIDSAGATAFIAAANGPAAADFTKPDAAAL